MLEIAALGLLQRDSLHGYRLKQELELFMSSCISVNYGTIYPLLKRLEQQGAITISKEQMEGSSRKVYQITQQGQELWKTLMMEHPQESWVNARSRFMIKFFFFSHLEPAERLKLLNHRLMVCHLRLETVEKQKIEQTSIDPYQTAVWQHCSTTLYLDIEWLQKTIEHESTSLNQLNRSSPMGGVS
jgi:DNA-binding PadR family transcriptional regulator